MRGDRGARRAFSLVVFGIITILIAILLPAMSRARAQAKSVQCQSNLRQIGQAMLMYANEHGGDLFPTDLIAPKEHGYAPMGKAWFRYVLHPTWIAGMGYLGGQGPSSARARR